MNDAQKSLASEQAFAHAAKAAVLQARPTLAFREEIDPQNGLPILVLDAPSTDRHLRVYFDNEEVTVGFQEWHHHTCDLDEALAIVDGISTGRDGVVVAEDADTHKWQGSGLVAVADEDEWLDFITSPRRTGARALRYRLTTWDSRGDREA